MNQYDATNVATGATTDLGLKSFMLGTYRYMMMAMGVTAVVAYFFGQYMVANPAVAGLVFSPFVLLGFVIAIPVLFGTVGAKLPSMSKGGVLAFLFGFSAFMGVFLSAVSFTYDPTIIAKIFFMTVALFGALSMFGYTTKTDLMPYLKFAAIGFLIYVVYMVASSFFPAIAPTGTLQMVVQGVALVLISVIAASKTQMLKRTYYSAAGNTAMLDKMSAYGAAMLLLTFINMFQILLSLFGRE
jgi:FtsH-binding integral membrane protein